VSFVLFLLLLTLFYLPLFFLKYVLRKNYTHPPTLFCAVFTVVLTMAYISHYLFEFYQISIESYAIYGTGNLAFIIGSLLAGLIVKRDKTGNLTKDISTTTVNLIKLLILVLVLYLPFAYNEFKYATPDMPLSLKILRIREKGLDEQVFNTITNNMIIMSSCVIMFVTYLFARKKIHIGYYIVAYGLFCFYNFITGTRAAILLITLSCIFVYLLNTFKTSKVFLISIATSAVILGAIVAIFMGKDGMDRDQGLVDNLNKVANNYFSYTVQGVILFDNYVVSKEPIRANWDILSGSAEVVNKIIGSNIIETDSKFSDFSHFSDQNDGNVYTIYFSLYPIYGVLGVIIFFIFYGAGCEILYNKGPGIVSILVGYINATLCLNIFNEQIFTNLIFTIKFIIFLIFMRFIERVR
jgi:oligosaccharide repeat unit polymerase